MLLYHGSPFSFDKPDIGKSKAFRDFGNGFYLAENRIDAETIALKNSDDGFVYAYEFDEDAASRELALIEFDDFSDEWLEFVFRNRMGRQVGICDIVSGPTAGGRVNALFDEYCSTNAAFEDVRKTMKREITDTRFGFQWCFLTERALAYLTLSDREYLERD